jgi:hypothetical protein
MTLTKNHKIYIVSALVIAVIVYFMFFRKKKTPAVAMAPATTKPAESGYFGEQWNWGTGAQNVTAADEMRIMRGTVDNSVAGTMENGYASANNAWRKTSESGFGGASNDNWLGY